MAGAGGGNDIQWCFSQVKGAVDDDVAEGKKAFNNAKFGYIIFAEMFPTGGFP
ncbi:PPP2R2A isoform 18 [Pan troglodytes]|uniref:PPP2R2A isoform 18 n=1 Tax=Pan troglodytes TaxID=9598 RepID=A0A2J8N8S1_PANTR|nr:PPP2R2A isoform 18 [Pan troglodytes]